MSQEELKKRLEGCYVTVPTPFADTQDLPVNESALRSYVRFLIDAGLTERYATLLAGGAAGDFSTMTFDERVRVAEIVVDSRVLHRRPRRQVHGYRSLIVGCSEEVLPHAFGNEGRVGRQAQSDGTQGLVEGGQRGRIPIPEASA